jgi:hypothetical protein
MADSASWMKDSPRSRRRAVLLSLFAAFVLLIALAAALWLSGAASWFRAEAEPEPLPVTPRTTTLRPRVAELLAMAPADLPAAVRGRYRLGPDRRLLQAVAEIHRLRTGKAAAPVKAELREGRWRILSGSAEVGTLSEFPGFEEATDLLARWADRLPAATTAPGSGDASGLKRALQEADAAALLSALSSPGGSPTDIMSGLAWLSTLTVDRLDQADPLLASAWAWLVLEPTRDAGSEALVARALGYEAAAARASAKLAADDPIRLYAAGDEPRLGTLCAGRPAADRPCHFLHLALLAERDQGERFHAALLDSPFKDGTSLAIRGLETRLSDFDAREGPGHAYAAAVAKPFLGKDDETPLEARTREFEAAVGRLASRPNAGPVDIAAIQAAHRAAFYSGLFDEANFIVNQYSSGPAARELAASMATPAAGTADELRRWLEVKGQSRDGSQDPRPLAEFLGSSRSIGAAPLADLGFLLSRTGASTDPLRRRPVPALFERLDTRPSHLVMAARMAERNLMSPLLFDQLARAASEAAPHLSEELPALAARMREDTVRLRAIADDPMMPRYTQMVALAALEELGKVDDAFVRARYKTIAADSDSGTHALVDLLEKRGDLAGASAALDAAIKRVNHHSGLDIAYLRTEKARLQLAMGKPDAAFATIQPALETRMEDAFLQGAKIELARNRAESALALAQSALGSYPSSSEASGLIAQARWRLNDFSTAAKELAANRNGIVGPWNRYLPEAFAAAFATAPEASVRQAFSELTAAGIASHVLARAAIALGEKRGVEIALPLLAGLHEPAQEWRDANRIATYDLIREKQGADAALAWIRAAIPDRPKGFVLTLYQMRKYDLLLGLYPNGEKTEAPSMVRMVKAAALLHLRETTGPRWDGLVAEIAEDPGDDFFAQAGRYLAGRADAAGLLKPVPNAGELASLGWAMGVKAASERRFTDAEGWLQVALESGQQQQPPHAWAWVIESEWKQAGRSLALRQKEGAF